MEKEKIKKIIEAILFVFSDPISAKEIKDIINIDINKKDIENILEELKGEYKEEKRGMQILKIQDKYQMGTNKEYEEYIRKLFEPKKKKSLTQATLETLTIIAYKQPITKVEIEEIRGVKCDKAISTLIEYNLIKEAGRLNRIGKPIIYKTTDEFLKLFGLEKIEELPPLNSFETN
ncbi:SMC-Scp complex subunit ScpB [Tepidibacter thalassicus]|uniref:Segregation and condensation protein B n=1 Tax=Tepidibacter thalassicus DSM 15285 TaxID=1123350 RepID=A0A1M5PZ18_9FIRM|nr:SMC-Scp complex subunit ScpB [Tepidibacter thalassicus]SHH06709.1 segregation and condensation protein B [Tepidibacter thalassicus DSM 15285]